MSTMLVTRQVSMSRSSSSFSLSKPSLSNPYMFKCKRRFLESKIHTSTYDDMFAYFKCVRFGFWKVFSCTGSSVVSTSGRFHKAFRNIYHPSLRTHFSNVGRTLHHSGRGVKDAEEEEENDKEEEKLSETARREELSEEKQLTDSLSTFSRI